MTHEEYKQVVVIAFGGPSSSGKTTCAKAVHSLIKNSRLIHLDDFYLADHLIPVDPVTGQQNWDVPEALDFARFTSYIKSIRQSHNLEDKIDTLEPDTNLKLTAQEVQQFEAKIAQNIPDLDNTLLVLVDGFMLFHDREIIQLFDVKLFFHASFETLKNRRESRKGYNTVEGFWVDPPNYFRDMVWPAYESSHKYLFENKDVDGVLKSEYKTQYQIHDIRNETGVKLYEVVDWSLQHIFAMVKRL
ncbi:uridine kinase activity [Scheffersomyces stipitis CBS 6054]|uniref:Uridine kinase activity n=1 Tax=Scheffersomyces stipitis (strain ATCC 58785 / CBS 6054 / NBRC 10063 / NRRL Y-11545) TaxID=322104 RepID=A3M083_PICST|nr:uridine kinase activity [Scheffersomyces stipitis CBS 6054]ABN68671.2 uridine kinase activity [Scheffersomyces stipitis CBS 6054]